MKASRSAIRWWHIAGLLLLVAILDAYELSVSIPALMEIAGASIFDMRVGGYGHGEAVAYLAALGSEGRWFYLSRHVPADTALALIEAIAIIMIIMRVTRPGARFSVPVPGAGRRAMLAAPVMMLVFDVGENALVAKMLVTGGPDPALVALASMLTQAKWVAISLAMALAIVLPVTAWLRARKRSAAHPQHASPR